MAGNDWLRPRRDEVAAERILDATGELFAEQSDVIKAMGAAFVISLEPEGDPAAVDRKARWLVRVLTSLLIFPGRNAEDERAMVEEFLVPTLAPIGKSV